ncbi:MAG TPA: hypothetical protein VFW44_15450 [Bryobacteraceae bacterium]|nr:hypothetical protein [Bryobacteraceae bacterium]
MISVLTAAGTCSLAIAQKGYIPFSTAGEITRPDIGQLWQQPDIPSENLLYGAGGAEHQPRGPFVFEKEDLEGTNPKFDVRDAAGVKWKIKLGAEAQPETAASRFVWAMGYHVDEDYFLDQIQVTGLPKHLHRGKDRIESGGIMRAVRLKRQQSEKKVGGWNWKDNRFVGSRELDGLRVMMAMIDNWDLKDENNAVRDIKRPGGEMERQFLVSDLGATFGSTGYKVSHEAAKGNVDAYKKADFIVSTEPNSVNFAVPSRPQALLLFDPPAYAKRVDMEWIGKQVPIQNVRWIAGLLSQLSDQQIRDAFRAAGYLGPDLDGFTFAFEHRVEELKKL